MTLPWVLLLALHLVVTSGDDGSVARRRGAVTAALAGVVVLLGGRGPRGAVVDVAGGGEGLGAAGALLLLALGAGVFLALGLAVVDVDVDAAGLAVAAEALVFVGWVGVFCDDVPGVNQAGNLGRGVMLVSGGCLTREGGGGGH
jgi:hypothetical protein